MTLGVGLDTFRPVTEDDLDEPSDAQRGLRGAPAAAGAVDAALAAGRRIVAVGHHARAGAGDGVGRAERAGSRAAPAS